jgi:hypothetical protein
MNVQVIKWKYTTPNQYRARAHVLGRIAQVYSDQTGHDHFAIQLAAGRQGLLEVIYNHEFGELPNLAIGMQVEACGDFINSNAQAGPYPPSPAGAIIHWVHINPSGRGHESGYLVIDGLLYGNQRPFNQSGAQGRARGQRHDLIPDYPVQMPYTSINALD